jgi:hypothetical protein
MKKNFKIILELIKKEETEYGAISIKESSAILDSFGKLAKKLGFECYVKGEKKEVLDYVPTGGKYELKTLRDVANLLTEEQFEMFIEDFRNFCKTTKNMNEIKKIFGDSIEITSGDGFLWVDSGKHEQRTEIKIETTNKL